MRGAGGCAGEGEGGGEGAVITNKNLTLTTAPSAAGVRATIDCKGTGRVLSMRGANVTLAALHLRNGSAMEGGLLWASGGALRVQDSVLEGGHATCRVWQNTNRGDWDPLNPTDAHGNPTFSTV